MFADLLKLLIENETSIVRAKESLRTRPTWNN
jgi:Ca2+-binding EF-hand superfamily protein